MDRTIIKESVNKIFKPDTYDYNDYSKVTIKLNRKGAIVKNIQGTLNLYFGAGLSEDGIYGKHTEDAVKSVQKKLGISGKVDINLANRLCKDDKVKVDETAEFKSDTDYYVLVSSIDSLSDKFGRERLVIFLRQREG